MRRQLLLALAVLALSVSALAQNPPEMETNFPPSPPGTGCAPGFTHSQAGFFCDMVTIGLHHIDGVYTRIQSTDVDKGDVHGNVPFFDWSSTADAKVKYYALYPGNGNTILNISNTGGFTTVTMAGSSPFPAGESSPVCIGDNTGVPAYNGCGVIQPGTVTYSGNFLLSFQIPQTSPIASCSSNCGEMAFGCGDLLPGRPGVSPCKLSFLIQHHQNNLSALSSPAYPFSQTWANSQAPAWTANTLIGMRDSVISGGFYCHNVTAGGGGVTGNGGAPNCNGAGTVVDGTVTWQQDGANAFPQEAACQSNYRGTSVVIGASDGSITATLKVLTAASNPFTAGQVGSPITVTGAGVAGGTLSSTIASFQNSGQVTLADAASTTVTGTGVMTTGNDTNAATANGTIINVNSAGAVVPPYSTTDIATCNPIWTENGWRRWFKTFNTGSDGNGVPGVIGHYAQVAWKGQIAYVAVGLMDLSEVFGWNNDKISTILGLSFAQYQAAYIDDYAGTSFKDNYAAWVAQGSPSWQLNTRTNGCSTCGSLSQVLNYATEVVTKAKAAYANYSFGNQGISVPWLAVNAAGTWATANTGFLTPVLDRYKPESKTVLHHLQTVTAGDCPTVAGLATIGHRQTDLVIGSSDGSITNGAAILTAASNPFTLAMVGAPITVSGAGVAGGTLTSTILSFQNSGQVTLVDNASTTVTGTGVMTWKGSCSTSPNNQVTQGSLLLWMPFAVQHGGSVFELFNTELFCAFDPNYTVANGLVQGAQPTYPDCQTDNYQTVWNNAAQGLPPATSVFSGTGRVAGTVKRN